MSSALTALVGYWVSENLNMNYGFRTVLNIRYSISSSTSFYSFYTVGLHFSKVDSCIQSLNLQRKSLYALDIQLDTT